VEHGLGVLLQAALSPVGSGCGRCRRMRVWSSEFPWCFSRRTTWPHRAPRSRRKPRAPKPRSRRPPPDPLGRRGPCAWPARTRADERDGAGATVSRQNPATHAVLLLFLLISFLLYVDVCADAECPEHTRHGCVQRTNMDDIPAPRAVARRDFDQLSDKPDGSCLAERRIIRR